MAESLLQYLRDLDHILKLNEPLAPFTYLKIGGPAEALAQPATKEELAALVRMCFSKEIPMRILGGGCNVLVRDEGVKGVVLRLSEPPFMKVEVSGSTLNIGSGASLGSAISHAARHGLAGLESLVGIPGTIGGALCHNVGDRVADIDQYVQQIEAVDTDGRFQIRNRQELHLGNLANNFSDAVITSVSLQLESDSEVSIIRRLRKAWIQRKSKQPLSAQVYFRAFRNPPGMNAAALIEQAELAGTRVGGAQVSERNTNTILIHDGATARDIFRLLDLIQSKVEEHFGVELEREPSVW